MTFRSFAYYVRALLRNLRSKDGASAILSAFGALWLLVELARFFFPSTVIFGNKALPDALRDSWPTFFTIGLCLAIWSCKPRLRVSHKVKGRDTLVEIAVGDIFSFTGAVIVGANTTFDTRIPDVISPSSVQGLFTRHYYHSEGQFEAEMSRSLEGIPFEALPGERVGNAKKYAMGTCVTVHAKERIGYLLAIADINEHGNASGTFEDLKVSLAKLWEHIGTRGSKEALLIPILGTGFSRLTRSREEIVHEIIKSFLAACSERTFTDKLTIVIMPKDMLNYGISLEELGSFLKHECNYTILSGGHRPAVGTAA